MITINSNGVREWLAQPSYRTPRFSRATWFIVGVVLGFVIAGFLCRPAHASPSCMSLHEARAVHPHEYLSWHGEHCWSDQRGGISRHERRHVERVPLPQRRIDTEASPRPQDWSQDDNWWFGDDAFRTDMQSAMLLEAARYRLRAQFDIRKD
jgi:hypothetical protein